jgi:hypothetical protein
LGGFPSLQQNPTAEPTREVSMSRVRAHAFSFDALEDRKLMTAAHRVAKPHTTPMIIGTPLVLNGTLAVDNNLASSMNNPDGSTTTSTPVAGNLSSLGKVEGVWNSTVDEFGDIDGPNVLRLANAKGSVIITFNTANAAKAHSAGHGSVYYARAQKLYTGTGAYAGATESGMLDMTSNDSKSEIESLTLKSANA